MNEPTVVEIKCERAGDRMQVGFRLGEQTFVDRCDPASARSRAALAKAACKALPGLDADDVEKELLTERERLFNAPLPTSVELDDPSAKGDAELAKMPTEIVTEAADLLRNGAILERILTDAAALGVTGEHELVLATYALGTSRLLSKPLAAIVQGASSSGKSFTVDTTAGMFPGEAVLLAHDLSPKALAYMEPGSLRHRWVCAGERSRVEDDDRAETTRMLREMLSSGKLRLAVAGKDGDRIVTRVVESDGPIAFTETTTLGELFDEDRNRCLLFATDDSADQTRAVLDAIGDRYSRPAVARDVERVRLVHHAAQRMLRRVVVAIPFAPSVVANMPDSKTEARRAASQCLGMVQAIALLRQFERATSPEHGLLIKATVDDYSVARGLLLGPMSRSVGGAVPAHVETFATWLRTTVGSESWKIDDLSSRSGCTWSLPTLHRHVAVLRSAGRVVGVGSDGRARIYRASSVKITAATDWLPEVSEIKGTKQ